MCRDLVTPNPGSRRATFVLVHGFSAVPASLEYVYGYGYVYGLKALPLRSRVAEQGNHARDVGGGQAVVAVAVRVASGGRVGEERRASRGWIVLVDDSVAIEVAGDLSAAFGVPVIEGVSAAVKLVEALATLGVVTSKVGAFAPSPPKAYSGPFRALVGA